MELIKTDRRKAIGLPKRMSLRQCLKSLGFSDEDIRCRKGQSNILQNWTNEYDKLLEMAKKKWKELSVFHHEANGGDPKKWADLNSIWSQIKTSISKCAEKQLRTNIAFHFYTCEICKRERRRRLPLNPELAKTVIRTQKYCHDSKECKRLGNNLRKRARERERKSILRRFCKYEKRGAQFTTRDKRKVFCSDNCCRRHHWKVKDEKRH